MLKSGDILLRPVQLSDADILYQAINTPELVRFNSPYKPVDMVNHLDWLTSLMKDESKRLFIIESEKKALGSIQLINIDLLHRNAELTIRMFKLDDCGKGLGTKALELVCDHAFRDLGLVRVWLKVFCSNIRAIKAYEKAGFIQEGCLKKAAFIDNQFVDVIIMGKLKDELS